MNEHSVDFELQSRVRKYLEYTLKNESNSIGENVILQKLNKSLKKELLMESLGKLLNRISIFRNNLSENTIEKLVYALKKIQMSPEEFLYNVLFSIFKYIFITK